MMTDFLDQSDHPKIAWSKTVKTPLASTVAPGPPATMHLQATKARSSISKKLAYKMEELSVTEKAENSNGLPCSRGNVTVESISDAASRGDIDGWDPMSFDHQSRKFNSYDKGLGAVLQNCKDSSTKNINLFVGGIPAAITKEGLRNLFSRAGKVTRVFIQTTKTGKDLTFGFVEFGTIREADNAMQQLNKFDMGNGVYLTVKVSETPEQREARLNKNREEDQFVSTLNCGRKSSQTEQNHKSELDEYVIETRQDNPLLPQYRSLIQSSPEKPKPVTDSTLTAGQALLSSSGAAASMRASPVDVYELNYSNDDCRNSPRNSKSPSIKSYGSSSMSVSSSVGKNEQSSCHVCRGLTFSRCSLCKTPYCGEKCQKEDWPKHQLECKLIQQGVTKISTTFPASVNEGVSSTIRLAENSDDDGFDISLDDVTMNELKSQTEAPNVSNSPIYRQNFRGKVLDHVIDNTSNQRLFSRPQVVEKPKTTRVKPASDHPGHNVTSLVHEQYTKKIHDYIRVPLRDILSQFDEIPQPLPSIPLNADLPTKFPAIVTAFLDAIRFTVVTMTSETMQVLKKLQCFGDSCSPSYVDPNTLSRGSKCGYKDQDMLFYRVEVIKVLSDKTAVIYMYDFGSLLKLPTSGLFCLPEDILLIPSLKVFCSLNNIVQLDSQDSSGQQLLHSLVGKKPVLIKVSGIYIGKFDRQIVCCQIESFDESVDIMHGLLTSTCCIAASSPNPTGNKPSQINSVDSYRLVHMSNKVSFHAPPYNEMITILPKVVISPNKIWAQVLHSNFDCFHRMQDDINAHYQSGSSTSYAPTVGQICIAKFSQDQCYYRAEVLCVNLNGTVDIMFVDLGIRETVTVQQLHFLKPVFLSLPKQGLQFSLAGVFPRNSSQVWDEAVVVFLKDKILNRRAQVKIVSGKPLLYMIEMYDPENPSVMLNSALIMQGNAQCVHSNRSGRPAIIPTTPTGSIVGVSISKKPSSTLSPKVESSAFLLNSLRSSSNKFVQTCNSQPPALSSNSDHNGVITPPALNPTSPTGSIVGVSINKQPFSTLTPKAESSSFRQNSPLSSNKKLVWTNNSQLPAISSNSGHDDILTPPLTSLSSPTESQSEDLLPSDLESLPLAQETPNKPKPIMRMIRNIEIKASQTSIQVHITHVTNPNYFWIQQANNSAIATFTGLVERLSRLKLSQLSSPSAGDLCICRFPDDIEVCRARVNSIKNEKVMVTYIDYGNERFIPLNEVYQLQSDLLRIRQQAILCTLNNLINPRGKGREWNRNDINFFKSMVVDRTIEMKIIKCMGLKHVVDIFVNTENGKRNLLQIMVEKGHGTSSVVKSPAIISKTLPKSVESFPRVSNLKTHLLPSGTFDALISEVHSPLDLFVQLATSEMANNLDRLTTELHSIFQATPLPLSVPPSKGSLCCAKFSDQCWYRAEVLGRTKSGCEVLFIDYGNMDVVELANVTLCPEEFVNMPRCAIRCGLDGIDSPNTFKSTWPIETIECLKKMTSEKILKARVVKTGELPLISLVDPSNAGVDDIGSELVKQGMACSPLSQSIAKSLPKSVESFPRVSDLETPLFPSGTFDALISEVHSPLDLFVQLATSETAKNLDRLTTELHSIFQATPPLPLSVPPSKGSLCCAKFSDQCWYRAEVLGGTKSGCEVLFIDYGNTDIVELANVTLCPEEFVNMPRCAIRCGLDGIDSPNTFKSTWPIETIECLKKMTSEKILKAKIVKAGDLPLISLVDPSNAGDDDIGSELVKQGMACSPLSQSIAKSLPKSVVSFPRVSDLETPLFPSGTFDALISEVHSPLDLFVQLATTEMAMNLDRLTTELHSIFQATPPLPLSVPPSKGSLCCAKFSDQCWYRAEVLEGTKSGCEVLFIDYGNTDIVELTNMTVCREEFVNIPCCAIRCGLDGIDSPNTFKSTWPIETIECLKKMTSEKILKARVVKTGELPLISLVDPSNAGVDDIGSELVKQGMACSPLSQSIAKSLPKSVESFPRVSDLETPLFPSGTFDALISEVHSPLDLFVQLATSETATNLDRLTTELHSIFQATPPLPLSVPPSKGSLCCAKFSDQCWYRAEVLGETKSGCEVLFIDYGNMDVVELANVTLCPEEFVNMPRCAIRCGLDGIDSPNTFKSTWPIETTECLKKMTSEKILKARVVKTGDLPLISLVDPSNAGVDDIGSELVKQRMACSPLSQSIAKSLPKSVESFPRVSDLETPLFPSGTFDALISEVHSPLDLFVQLATSETATNLDRLTTELHSIFQATPPLPLSVPPSKGSLCCAKFSDQCWYRAEVLGETKSGCEVLFIDYGNTDMVKLTNMTMCPEELVNIPRCAIRCGLDGIDSPNTFKSTWPIETTECLKKMTSEKILKARVVKTGDLPLISLVDPSNAGVDDIGSELVKQGMACSPLSQSIAKSLPKSVESFPRVSDLETPLFPSGTFDALISEVHSPLDLFVQLATSETATNLDRLTTELHSIFQATPPLPLSVPPSKGSLCCAKFSDQCWYRAEVLGETKSGCEVLFIDYGNTDIVKLTNMTMCPEELVNIPRCAIRCGLDGIDSPNTFKSTWPIETIECLKKMTSEKILKAKIVKAGDLPLISLVDPSNAGVDDIGFELVKQGMACSPLSQSIAKSLPKSVDSFPRVSDLETPLFPSGTFDALISEVYSPLDLFVQLATTETAMNLDRLTTELHSVFQATPPLPLSVPPSKGSLCCAKFSDQCWYRAEVLEGTKSGCEVLFIDYGNTDIVKLTNMTMCPEELVNIPRCAIRCGLDGIDSPNTDESTWPIESTAYLRKISSERILQAIVIETDSAGSSLIDFCDISLNLKDELFKNGYAKAYKKTKLLSRDLVSSLPQITDLKEYDLPSTSHIFKICISEIYNPQKFFIQLATQQVAMSINTLSPDLTYYFKSHPPVPIQEVPRTGSVCCSKFSQDGLYYRVEVLSSSNSKCEILFIDYGNMETALISDMVPCPSQFFSVPVCATKCALNGVVSLNTGWSKQASDSMKKSTNDQILNARFSGKFSTDNSALVDIELPNGESLADLLIKSGLAQSPVASTMSPLDKPPVISWHSVKDLKNVVIPTSADGFKVLVSEVIDPTKIYVQIATQETIANLDILSKGLDSIFSNYPPVCLTNPPSNGTLCCAKYSADGCCYRVEVLDSLQTSFKIRFIDYGNEETVPLSTLRPCPEELLSIPICATHCCLEGVRPSGVSWSSNVSTFLKQVSQDSILLAKCVGANNSTPVVQITNENGKSLGIELIKYGFALPSKKSIHSATSPSLFADRYNLTSSPTRAVPSLRLPTGVCLSVNVVHIVDPSLFCIQLNERKQLVQLNELMKKMQGAYSNLSKYSGFKVTQNSFCCAKFADDECFYRSKVIRLQKDSVLVRFIDFGSTAVVSTSNVYHLDETYTTQPSFTVICSLDEVKSVSRAGWSMKSIELFKDQLCVEQTKAMSAFATGPPDSDGVVPVKLYFDESCSLSVANYLVQNKCAVFLPQNQPATIPANITPTVVSGLRSGTLESSHKLSSKLATQCIPIPHITLPTTQKFPVLVTHINSYTDIYFQIATHESLKTQMKLIEDVLEYSIKVTPYVETPPVGEFCIAQYDGDTWFRAQVIQQVDAKTCEVHFIDFGNKENVVLSQMKPVAGELLSIPIQAVSCGLYGAPFNKALVPNSSASLLKTLISTDSIFMCVVISEDPLFVDFECKDGLPTPSVQDVLKCKKIFPLVSDCGSTCLQARSLPSTESSIVVVTDISHVGDFWLQVADVSMLAAFESLTQKLQDYCQQAERFDGVPVLGQLVCAMFSQDGVWYRARVVEMLSPLFFEVSFIDFGNSEVTDTARIKPFKPEFMNIPVQAVHCCLVGFPDSYQIEKAITSQFRSLVENRQMIAFHRGMYELYTTRVELVDTTGDNDVYIHHNILK